MILMTRQRHTDDCVKTQVMRICIMQDYKK